MTRDEAHKVLQAIGTLHGTRITTQREHPDDIAWWKWLVLALYTALTFGGRR